MDGWMDIMDGLMDRVDMMDGLMDGWTYQIPVLAMVDIELTKKSRNCLDKSLFVIAAFHSAIELTMEGRFAAMYAAAAAELPK